MSQDNLSILYITSFIPHGETSGAQLRVLNIAKHLARIGKMSMIIVTPEKDNIEKRALDDTCNEFDVRHVFKIKADPIRSIKDRVKYEVNPSYMNTHYYAVDKNERDIALQLFKEYKLIWVHSIRTANVFRMYHWKSTVLDVDDIQSRLYHSFARNDANIARKIFDYRLSFLWWRREKLFSDRFEALTVCSDEDKKYFNKCTHVHVVPNGYEKPSIEPVYAPVTPCRLGFIGSFGFEPNYDGIRWFIKKIWPIIKSHEPDARLRLAGKNNGHDFQTMGMDIDELGYVEDPKNEISSWTAMIVPIRIGAGTRVKIAEAFSRKCPVVATTLGAYGYEVRNSHEIMIANEAKEFAFACIRLMKDREYGKRISENAWNIFIHKWSWEAVGNSVEKVVNQVVK